VEIYFEKKEINYQIGNDVIETKIGKKIGFK